MKYGYRFHRGGLKESLDTKVYISESDFIKRSKNYHYYGWDSRCRQFMFIRNEMEKYYKEPNWLFIELEKEEN